MERLKEDRSPKRRRYDEAFKGEAVRLVTEQGYTFQAAAMAVGESEQFLREWRNKLGPPPTPCGEDASVAELKADNARLHRELKRAQIERNSLTAYFARETESR